MANRKKPDNERRSEKIQIQAPKTLRDAVEGMIGEQGSTMSDVGLNLLQIGLRHAEIERRKPAHVLLHRLATAPCGPWEEAIATSDAFVLSADVAAVLGAEEGDVIITADGESMVGAGIPDGATLIMRYLGTRMPKTGEVCLVQATLECGTCVGSVKTWLWDTNGFHLEDGDAVAFGFPEGTVEVRAVARKIAMLSKG